MTAFRTLDERRRQGQARACARRPQRPVDDGKVTDATRIERVAPTITRDRRQGRQGDPARPFRPAEGQARAGIVARAGRCRRCRRCSAGRSPSPTTASAPKAEGRGRGDEGRRRPAPGEHPLPHGRREERSGLRRSACAKLGDIYVNDAFSAAHRAHASTEGLAHLLPAYAGRAMQAELEALEAALGSPKRPVVAIVGGAKVSTKIDLLENLVGKVDALVIGGGMANTFLAAKGIDDRQVAGRAGPRRHGAADHGEAATAGCADRAADRRRRREASSRRTRRTRRRADRRGAAPTR